MPSGENLPELTLSRKARHLLKAGLSVTSLKTSISHTADELKLIVRRPSPILCVATFWMFSEVSYAAEESQRETFLSCRLNEILAMSKVIEQAYISVVIHSYSHNTGYLRNKKITITYEN